MFSRKVWFLGTISKGANVHIPSLRTPMSTSTAH